jgi:hypothetical protein
MNSLFIQLGSGILIIATPTAEFQQVVVYLRWIHPEITLGDLPE